MSVSKRKCLVNSCTEGRFLPPLAALHAICRLNYVMQGCSRIHTVSNTSVSSARPRKSAKLSRHVSFLSLVWGADIPRRVQVSKNKETIQSLLSGLKAQPRFGKMAEYSIECLSG